MAGTILKTLLSTHQTDNTAITAANSGFTSGSAGAGNTAVHLDAAKMAASEGYRLTQAGANQNIWYLDLASTVTKLAFRVPFNYSTVPAVQVSILRAYPDTAHATVHWTLSITTTNRLQFFETATGGLNLSSPSGTPLSPGTDYVAMGLIDTDTMTLTINVYPRGSLTPVFTMSGTLATTTAMQSVRWGIGTNSALAQIDTNDAFAIGSGDMLVRADVASVALSLSGAITPADKTIGTPLTLTLTAAGGNGNTLSYSCVWDGTSMGPQSSNVFTHTDSAAGTKNWSATASQAV